MKRFLKLSGWKILEMLVFLFIALLLVFFGRDEWPLFSSLMESYSLMLGSFIVFGVSIAAFADFICDLLDYLFSKKEDPEDGD